MTDHIQRELFLQHAPEEVWRALTERAALEDWLLPNDFEPRVGHRFTFRTQPNPQYGFDGLVHCEVLECASPSRLAYTWTGGGLDTRVTYRLERDGDGTRLFFEQAGFDTSSPGGAGAMHGAELGWERMLGNLARAISKLPANH